MGFLYKYGFFFLTGILSAMTYWSYVQHRDIFGVAFGCLTLFCIVACLFELLIYHSAPKIETDRYDRSVSFQSKRKAMRVIKGGKK